MLPVDPLTIASMLVLAGSEPTCPTPPLTRINIIPSTSEVKYDTKQTLKQLQGYSTDTVDPYGFHGVTVTQAFMKGQIKPSWKLDVKYDFNERYGFYCLWYNEVTVKIEIDPTIVIAKELYEDRCMRKALIEHEMKHVKVDRIVVNKYAKTIGKKIYDALAQRGFSVGPIPAKYGQDTMDRMHRVVNQILDLEFRKMGIERMEQQRAVDTLEEYQSVDDQCPLFKKNKQKIYADLHKSD